MPEKTELMKRPTDRDDSMPKNPIVDDDKLFDLLLDASKFEQRRKETDYPWSGVMEDREVVHDALTKLYTGMHLPRPRFTWCRSPMSMFGALQYLRQMQIGSRQEAIKGIVRGGDPMEAEIRATFLESIMDKDITVTMGACLRNSLLSRTGLGLLPVRELSRILEANFTPPPNGRPLPAGWRDWAFYPVDCAFNYALQSQAFILCPFVKAVWICRPPIFIHTDDEGHLHCADGPAARWEDGYEVYATYEAPERLPEPQDALALEESTTNQPLGLPAPQKEDV